MCPNERKRRRNSRRCTPIEADEDALTEIGKMGLAWLLVGYRWLSMGFPWVSVGYPIFVFLLFCCSWWLLASKKSQLAAGNRRGAPGTGDADRRKGHSWLPMNSGWEHR